MIFITFFFSSCGERQERINSKFTLNIDTNTLVSGSTIDPSNRPTDPLYVAGKGRLEFFGIVVRELDSTLTVDAAGIPVGKVIPPPSSLMLTSWTNKTQLINILTTGKAEVNVQIPLGRNLSVTTYMVFIEDDINLNGPGTLTTVFDVSSAINIATANQEVVLNVNTNNILDDAAPFVDWFGAFADANGNALPNTDIFLRHCMIGFEFSQSMFGVNPDEEEKNFFRTDARGWVRSIGISGVDFEIRAAGQIIKPCGQPSIDKNYPAGSPEIAFTGFKGATRFNDPGLFNDSLSTAGNTTIFAGATTTVINTMANDPDGDGLSTTQELSSSLSNPFVKNYVIKQNFDHDIAGISGPYYNGSTYSFYFRLASGNSCTSATANIYPFLGSNALSVSPNISTTSSDASGENCQVSFTPTFSVTPSDGHYLYQLEIITPITSLTATSGRTIPINLYRPFVVTQGTAPAAETITAPTIAYYLRNWDSETFTAVSPTNILPILDDAVDQNYQAIVKSADLLPGGIFYYTKDNSCAYSQLENNKVAGADFQAPGIAVIHLEHRDNMPKDLFLCHRKSSASTVATLLGAIHFGIDTTRTYAQVMSQNSGLSLPSGYQSGAVIRDTTNARTLDCALTSTNNALISTHTDAGVRTEIDYTSTTLNGLSVSYPLAITHPVSGLPTCGYYDDTNKNKVILVSVDASGNALEQTAVTLTTSVASGARYAYRSPKLFVISFDSAGSTLEGKVFDLSASNATVAYFDNTVLSTAAFQMVVPLITSEYKYVMSEFAGGNINSYAWNGSTNFSLIAGSSFTPSATPVTINGTTDSLGNSYVFTTSSPEGADLYKFYADQVGTVIFASGTYAAPTGQMQVGMTKGRFTYTDGGAAKYYDPTTSSFINLMSDYLFSGMTFSQVSCGFNGDLITYSLYESTNFAQTIIRMTVK